MCFISVAEAAGLHYDSDYLHYVPRLRPPAVSTDSLLANICRLMSPLTAITTHNVITPLNSLLPSALWLLVPAAHHPTAKKHSQPVSTAGPNGAKEGREDEIKHRSNRSMKVYQTPKQCTLDYSTMRQEFTTLESYHGDSNVTVHLHCTKSNRTNTLFTFQSKLP